MPLKFRVVRKSILVTSMQFLKVTWGGEWASIRQSPKNTMVVTIDDDTTCPKSPNQLTLGRTLNIGSKRKRRC